MATKTAAEYDRVKEAAAFLTKKLGAAPPIVVQLGSGLGSFADRLTDPRRIAYSDIPHWKVPHVQGHAGELMVGLCGDSMVVALAGRVHLYEGHTANDVAFAVRAVRAWGAASFIVTNAAGGINAAFSPGDLMLIRDHISLQGQSPLAGANDERFGPRFPDMTYAYDRVWQQAVRDAAQERSIVLREGVYAAMPGPSYETPAEIRMLRIIGADAVGMSTVPEVIAANHVGLRVVGLSCITNFAAGIKDQPLTHDEVKETADGARERFEGLLTSLIMRMR